MGNELVKPMPDDILAPGDASTLPKLVERAGGAARFAWDEFFYAEHHNPHTQQAYERAVRRFLSWCEGQGVELPGITPSMVGQFLVGLGGSPAKRNEHLAALRGFFDRLVNRHVCILNPAASVKGVKEQVIEGKMPQITIEQAKALLASIRVARNVKTEWGGRRDSAGDRLAGPSDPGDDGLYHRARGGGGPAAAGRLPARRDAVRAAVPREGGKSREIPVRHNLEGYIRAYV